MSNKIEEQLKPCPLCGDTEHKVMKPRILPWEHGFIVNCPGCNLSLKVQTKHKSQSLHSWNRRDGKLDLSLD